MIIKPQFEFTVDHPPNRIYLLLGAGGTGARLAALLPRLVSPGDKIIVVDGDSVETRNLSRQHFLAADVGRPKSDVVAKRILVSLPPAIRDQVEVTSIPEKFEYPKSSAITHVSNTTGQIIMLGCVDNYEARNMMHRFHKGRPYGVIWIDCGNDMRWGQVVASFNGVVVTISQSFLKSTKAGTQLIRGHGPKYSFSFDGVKRFAPGLLEPPPIDPNAAPDCGVRLDTQTVAANQMAATAAGALLAQIVDGLPISAPCVEFSTAPPIMNARTFPAASAYYATKTNFDSWFPPEKKKETADGPTDTTKVATVV